MWAIIGSSGFEQFDEFETLETLPRETPFGLCSNGLQKIKAYGREFLFLPRTSAGENVLPSNINNRANIYALKKYGATAIAALSSVRSLRTELKPGDMVVPYQYIDRTKSPRHATFCDDNLLAYVSLAHPSSENIAKQLRKHADFDYNTHFGQAYVCIEGPQFPTMLDAKCYQSMGAGVIGMTAFPEYALAREAGLHYLPCNFIVDYLPWSDDTPNIDCVLQIRHTNYEKACQLIRYIAENLQRYENEDCHHLGLANTLNIPVDQLTISQQAWFHTIIKSNVKITPRDKESVSDKQLQLSHFHSGIQPMPKKLQDFLSFVNKYKPASDQKENIEAVRKNAASLSLYAQPPVNLPSVRNFTVKINKRQVPVRLYHPDPEQHLPLAVYVHGGGFVSGTLDSFDPLCRAIAKKLNRVVVSIDYHLAPEHPFPTGFEDVYESTKWLAKNAKAIKSKTDDLILIGDSSGACYSALVTAKSLQERHFKVSGQILVYPTADMTHDYPSMDEFSTGYLLEAERVRWYNKLYIPKNKNKTDPDISPMYAENIEQFPPTMVMTAGYDPLKDEGITFAAKLAANGVDLHHYHFDDMIHAFLNFGKLVPETLNTFYERIHSFVRQIG